MDKDYFIIQDELASRFWLNVKSELLKTNNSYKDLANYLMVDSAVLNTQSYLKGRATLKISRAIQISSFFKKPLSYFFIQNVGSIERKETIEKELDDLNKTGRSGPISTFLLSLTKIQLRSVYTHILSFFDITEEDIIDNNLNKEEEKCINFNFSINENDEDVLNNFLTSFYERLENLLTKKNITLNVAAKSIKLSQSTLYPQIREKRDSNLYAYIAICEKFNFSIDYLVYGIGSSFGIKNVQKKYDEFVSPAREYIFNEAVKSYNRFTSKDYVSLIIEFFPNLNDNQIKFITNHILSY